jgi:hypothetical protein
MEHIVGLGDVPTPIEMKVGATWGSMKEFEFKLK